MGGRRGQLLLIGGLGLAMTLVVLAIVLNTVIFTQNLATREAVDARSPIEFTGSVERGVGGAISAANYRNTSDYSTLDAEFRRAVSTWAGNTSRFAASRGMATDVTVESTMNGTRVLQSSERQWRNETGTTSWTMATNVSRTRRFHANLSRASLANHTESSLESSGVFRIEATNSTAGETWSLYVYRDQADPQTVNLTATGPDGTNTTCSAVASDVDIDATTASIEGAPCDFTFAENVTAPYNISVQHGENASGRYTFVVDRDRPTMLGAVGANYNNSTPGSAPYTVPAIYAADVSVVVDRADITFSRTITVAPEEPLLGERYNVSA